MPITVQHQKEALGKAYVGAVIAKAGYNTGKSDFDYGFDGTIKEVINRNGRYVENGISINYQLKSSCDVSFSDEAIQYDLEAKNYNDLVSTCYMIPSILILYVLPEIEADWLCISPDNLIIKKCAWWCSLKGLPQTDNTTTKRISIPIKQVFSPASLAEIMKKIQGGESL